MEAIPRHRFRILTLGREPLADLLATEMEWYRDPQEVVIGTVYQDVTDRDWGYIVLGRDGRGQFRWIDGSATDATTDRARERLWAAMRAALVSGKVTFPQGDEAGRKLNRLMHPVHPPERLHPSFRLMSQDTGYSPAAHLISEITYVFTDPDGNFIEQFQTTGFDSRVWELYLFVTLREEGCRLDRSKNAPDFVCNHFGLEFSVEAVTMNPSQAGLDPEPPEDPAQLRYYNENFTPIRFGSALLTKLRKEYWKLPHVTGKPLVLAIQDFHQPRSMTWSHSGLPTYLYGYRYEPTRDERGNLVIKPVKVDRHVWGTRTLRSGFFSEPGAEHISAVMFSNSATVSKFNRIGKLARFGEPRVRLIRTGEAVNLNPNADRGVPFRHEVDEQYQEEWSEGLAVFHNPRALVPLPLDHFPNLVHHRMQGNLVETVSNRPFHPLWSFTEIIRPQG
jgi:hypothetical protein